MDTEKSPETQPDIKEIIKASGRRQVSPSVSRALAIVGVVASVAAWCIFFFDGMTAMIVAICSLVALAPGLFVGKGCLRDIAITAIIASVILIIVFALFYWGVPHAVKSL